MKNTNHLSSKMISPLGHAKAYGFYKNKLQAPVITEIADVLSGQAKPHQWIRITVGEDIYLSQANHKGVWQLQNPIPAGTSASIVSLDHKGHSSAAVMVSMPIQPIILPNTPEVTEQGQWLKGTADPYHLISIRHGEEIYVTSSDANGFWQIENPIYLGGSLTIVAINQQGQSSLEIAIAQLPALPPQSPNILTRDEWITGYADPESVVVMRHSDVEIRITPDEMGFWQVLNPIYGVGGSVLFYAENEYGLTSHEIGFAVLPMVPSVPNIVENGEYLVGTAEPDSTVVMEHQGIETRIEVNEQGEWTVLNPIYITGGFLSIHAENEYGLVSPKFAIAVLAPPAPLVFEAENTDSILLETASVANLLQVESSLAINDTEFPIQINDLLALENESALIPTVLFGSNESVTHSVTPDVYLYADPVKIEVFADSMWMI